MPSGAVSSEHKAHQNSSLTANLTSMLYKVDFDEYVQTHKEYENSMATCTVGTIATHPTGNTHGGYYFIHLDTGCHINRHDRTSLSMPTEVIDQVH